MMRRTALPTAPLFLFFLWFGATLLASTAAMAGGLVIPDYGVRALGRAGAFVVGADDLMALHYNPAALTHLKRTSIHVDMALIDVSTSFQRAPGIVRPDGEVIDPDFIFPRVENEAGPRPVPGLLFGSDLGVYGCEECAVAFGLYAPYSGFFRYPDAGPQRYGLVEARPVQAFISAAFARPVGRWLKVGVSVSAVYVAVIQKQVIQFTIPGSSPNNGTEDPRSDVFLSANLSAWDVNFGAGVLLEPVSWFALGASVQTPYTMKPSGALDMTNADGAGLPSTGSLELSFPVIARFGALVRPFPSLEIEADMVYYGWSSFEEFTIEPDPIGFGGVDLFSIAPVTFAKQYSDVWNPRIGVEYKGFNPLRLRAGFYAEAAAVPVETGVGDSLNGNKRLWSVGMTYDFGSWDFDVAFAHISTDPRSTDDSLVNSINLVMDLENRQVVLGPNTVVGNGSYEASSNIIGVGFHFYPGRDRSDIE